MGKFVDLTGQRFGRLTVIKQGEYYIYPANGYRYVQWLCKCDCGNERTVRACTLRSGDTQSCGCIAKEILIKRNTTHNKYHSRLHSIWSNMKNRCSNPNSKRYKDYGEEELQSVRSGKRILKTSIVGQYKMDMKKN